MEQDERKHPRATAKIWTGLFLIVIGLLLFAHKLNAGLPDYIFSWPMLAIAIGLLIGIQHRFRTFIWIIPVVWGSFALVDQLNPQLNLHDYTAPLVLVLLGLFFIVRRSRYPGYAERREWKEQWKKNWRHPELNNTTDGEWLDSTSVFGGAKKVILSKNFKGGDITCFMGGAEIDLSQADIQGKVVMDTTAVFGGIKLIIPPNWDLKIEITAVFGGVEDKRPVQVTKPEADKVLVLDGAAVFGGIEVNCY
jgi:predicted membrane protein